MKKKSKNKDALTELLEAASHEVLADLIQRLCILSPEVRRECFEFLKSKVSVSKALKKRSEGEIVLALWWELEPELSEMDECGGADYAIEDQVVDLLAQIRTRLEAKRVDLEYRRELLDLVLPFIESGNTGLNDFLHEVAHAACYDDADSRRLAEAFEAMPKDWERGRARDIYRRIGDRDKYLELRQDRMEYGADYHDLATFHWECGEKEKALQVAKEGLRKGQGRMDELRAFVADRARESGDRDGYMKLQSEHAMDGLTLDKYKAFKKKCTKAEWALYEPQIIAQLKNTWRNEQLKIHMYRKEYDKALDLLTRGRYPMSAWEGSDALKAARKLEKRYPQQILAYYLSGLGKLNFSATRKEYTRKAGIMADVRRVMVDVMGDEDRWKTFAVKVKQENIRRPALQEEFAKILPGWRKLK